MAELIDLKAHYLDLIVTAISADGSACLHRAGQGAQELGAIYVTRSPKVTKADFVLAYDFNNERCAIGIQFADQRPKLEHIASYVGGLDDFWPKLRKALTGNRIENKGA